MREKLNLKVLMREIAEDEEAEAVASVKILSQDEIVEMTKKRNRKNTRGNSHEDKRAD